MGLSAENLLRLRILKALPKRAGQLLGRAADLPSNQVLVLASSRILLYAVEQATQVRLGRSEHKGLL